MSSLELAALHEKSGVVQYLSSLPQCSREDRINALELLGTASLFKTNSDIQKARQYFEKAMQERQKDPVKIKPKCLDVLVSDILNKEQCKTLYDLEKMKDDEFAL